MNDRIPISRPWFGEEERRALVQPLETGWVVQGPRVREFEEQFAAFVGVPFAAATTSCTTALHLAVVALGLRPGDEVIVPAFTWVSTANAVEYAGATPIFCDIDLETFNIDVDQLAALVGPRTVGVIPVHLFGLCADMTKVMSVAQRHGLWVVEDAACGFGARLAGRHAGTFGEAGCFSFHPRKALTTGEGGMVTTMRADLDQTVRCLRDHGAARSDHARHHSAGAFLLSDYDVLGFNYRMTDFQGALGVAQLGRADDILASRRHQAGVYDRLLLPAGWLRTPRTPVGYEHGYQSYVTLYAPEPPTLANVDRLSADRNRIMAALEEQGIATRQGTHSAALTAYYASKYGHTSERFPRSFLAERLSLALPLFAQLTDDDQARVAAALVAAVERS